MNNSVETIFDDVVHDLRGGASLEHVYAKYPEHAQELRSLAPLMHSLVYLPTVEAPRPIKQRRYLEALQPKSFSEIFANFVRVTIVPTSILAGIAVISVTAYAANNSKPGQHLFTVKRSIEQTTLALTPQDQKAQAKLLITEKRLEEATQILSSPNPDPEAAQAALSALTNQTKETFEDVKKAATNNDLSPADVTVLNTLAEISKKQAELITNAQPKSDSIARATADAAEQNKLASKDIQEFIAVVNDKALASLNNDPNTITVSNGTITAVDKTKVTVEKTVFTFGDKTSIIDKDGTILTVSALTIKSKVTITGTKADGVITAKKIVVMEVADTGNVKGDSTKTPSTTPTQGTTPKPDKTPDQTNPTPDDTPLPPNNNVTGTLIYEQP